MSLPDGWQVSHVLPEHVHLVWPQIEPIIERGLRHGAGDSTTVREIRTNIERGDSILWAVHEGQRVIAAVVLSVVQRPLKKVVFVVVIAGERFHEWAPHVNELIRDYRDLIGADAVEALVRKGMTKWLPDLGWERKAVLMEMRDG